MLLFLPIGALYAFIFYKIGQWVAERREMGIFLRFIISFFLYITVYISTYIVIDVVTGELLTKRGMGGSVGISAIMAAIAFFMGSKSEEAE